MHWYTSRSGTGMHSLDGIMFCKAIKPYPVNSVLSHPVRDQAVQPSTLCQTAGFRSRQEPAELCHKPLLGSTLSGGQIHVMLRKGGLSKPFSAAISSHVVWPTLCWATRSPLHCDITPRCISLKALRSHGTVPVVVTPTLWSMQLPPTRFCLAMFWISPAPSSRSQYWPTLHEFPNDRRQDKVIPSWRSFIYACFWRSRSTVTLRLSAVQTAA